MSKPELSRKVTKTNVFCDENNWEFLNLIKTIARNISNYINSS